MNGAPSDPEMRGITPRAVAKILEAAERLKSSGWMFDLEATFIEIYNEGLRDLLGEEAPGRLGKAIDGSAIKHNAGGHTQVCIFKLTAERNCTSSHDAHKVDVPRQQSNL
jgi:kinesin family member C1